MFKRNVFVEVWFAEIHYVNPSTEQREHHGQIHLSYHPSKKEAQDTIVELTGCKFGQYCNVMYLDGYRAALVHKVDMPEDRFVEVVKNGR